MVFISYSHNGAQNFDQLIFDIKKELLKKDIAFTEDFNSLKSGLVDTVLVLHSNNYLLDEKTRTEYEIIKQKLEYLNIVEINLDDSKSELQENGFAYYQHKNNSDTVATIYNALIKGYTANFAKTKISKNHKMVSDNEFINLTFGFKNSIIDPIIYIIFQGKLSNEPSITSVKLNDESFFDYDQIYESIEMEKSRIKDGIKLYVNRSVNKEDKLDIQIKLLDKNVEGFYVWIEDSRQWEYKKIDSQEFEKIYFNLHYNIISEM